jgi:outer membrane protein TolC
MVSRVATVVTVLFLLVPRPSAAQEPLTLDQAVSAALANNALMRAAKAGEREAAAHVDEARASYLPRVDYIESWQRGNDPVYVFGSLLLQQQFTAANFNLDSLNHPDPLTNHQGMFVVQQPIFDSARLAGIRSAGLGSQIAQDMTAEGRAGLALGVTRVYGMVLQAIAGRKAADAAVETAQDELARTEQRRDAGLVTEADVLSLKVFLAQMQEGQIRAASGEAIARARLNQLMGVALDKSYALLDPPPPSAAALPSSPADDEAAAIKNRPTVRQADAQLALASTARTAAKAAFLPQASVQGMYEMNGSTFGSRASAWMVSGQLRFNLFAGGGDAARLKVASAAEARAKAERDNVLDTVRLEVRTARAEYEAAVAREAVGRAAVLQARESQRIIRDRYESGMGSVTDVLRAATALLDAETLRIASIVDVMVSRAALDKAVGRPQ